MSDRPYDESDWVQEPWFKDVRPGTVRDNQGDIMSITETDPPWRVTVPALAKLIADHLDEQRVVYYRDEDSAHDGLDRVGVEGKINLLELARVIAEEARELNADDPEAGVWTC